MPPKKYIDFVEKPAEERRGKAPPYAMRNYVDVICPHCNTICAEIPEEFLKQTKASECLKHLRVCEVFKAKGGEVVSAPEKKKSEIDTLKAEMAAIRGDISAIWSIVGGGDPAPTTMVELKERLPQKVDEIGVKRKREEELSVYHGWTKKEEKELRTIVRGDMLEANKRS